jgi:hypothetical protein
MHQWGKSLDKALSQIEVEKLAKLMKQVGNWAKIEDMYYTPEELIEVAPRLKPAMDDIKQVNPLRVLANGHAHVTKLQVQLNDFEKRVKEYFKG